MENDQATAERKAVQMVLGEDYTGKTIAEVSTDILTADAKNYTTTEISYAYLNSGNDNRSTVENAIKELKARIFLEKYCGIQLS